MKDIEKLFRDFKHHSIQIYDIEDGRKAVVVLSEMKDARLACEAVSRKVVGDRHVEVRLFDKIDAGKTSCIWVHFLDPLGIELKFPANTIENIEMDEIKEMIRLCLDGVKYSLKDICVSSNVSALIGFGEIKDAVRAQASLQSGAVSLVTSEATLPSRLTILPAYSCEITGYPVENSVSSFDDALPSGLLGFRKYERKAILKMRRHMHVLPTIVMLKKMDIEGESLHPERYSPLVGDLPTEYDRESEVDEFDRFSLRTVLKDYLHADPATRYMIAKNRFERALHDAKVYFYFYIRDLMYVLVGV